mmetsp:Transcript_18912/g.72124  ORF Transcript_18912/g.72124 Transcript_18912/m.72124 type:complete len:358 (-) Transcript_18912:483-1556(-)
MMLMRLLARLSFSRCRSRRRACRAISSLAPVVSICLRRAADARRCPRRTLPVTASPSLATALPALLPRRPLTADPRRSRLYCAASTAASNAAAPCGSASLSESGSSGGRHPASTLNVSSTDATDARLALSPPLAPESPLRCLDALAAAALALGARLPTSSFASCRFFASAASSAASMASARSSAARWRRSAAVRDTSKPLACRCCRSPLAPATPGSWSFTAMSPPSPRPHVCMRPTRNVCTRRSRPTPPPSSIRSAALRRSCLSSSPDRSSAAAGLGSAPPSPSSSPPPPPPSSVSSPPPGLSRYAPPPESSPWRARTLPRLPAALRAALALRSSSLRMRDAPHCSRCSPRPSASRM